MANQPFVTYKGELIPNPEYLLPASVTDKHTIEMYNQAKAEIEAKKTREAADRVMRQMGNSGIGAGSYNDTQGAQGQKITTPDIVSGWEIPAGGLKKDTSGGGLKKDTSGGGGLLNSTGGTNWTKIVAWGFGIIAVCAAIFLLVKKFKGKK